MRLPGIMFAHPRGRLAVWAMACEHGLFALIPVLVTGFLVFASLKLHNFAYDFHYAYWPAGHRILGGASPYVDVGSPQVAQGIAFVYPALAAVVLAPLSLIPSAQAGIAFTAVNLLAVPLALRLLRVEDWRLYGLALLWPPVITGWQNANLTLLLVLGLAALWRWRGNPLVAGVLVALLISVKLFLWPLTLWLLATRRFAALAYCAVAGLALNLAAWSILGLGEMSRYARLLGALSRAEANQGYSVAAFAVHQGLAAGTASAIQILLVVALAGGCVRAGQRGRQASAFLLSIAMALMATPILWTHYFALLLVPLAIARPRLGVVWALPLAMLVCPETPPSSWRHAVALVVGATLVAYAWRRPLLLTAKPAYVSLEAAV